MPVDRNWLIDVSLEDLLRQQKIDLQWARCKRPDIVKLSEEALAQAKSLLEPTVVFRQLGVDRVEKNHLILSDGFSLENQFLADQLVKADAIIVVVCTIGSKLDHEVEKDFAIKDYALGYDLDVIGGISLSHLESQFYAQVESDVHSLGKQVSCRYSPGMANWTIDQGQPPIFSILPECKPYVELLPSMQMLPLKSISWVIGVGTSFPPGKSPCKYCMHQGQCDYRSGYEKIGCKSIEGVALSQ
jgi:hypothetical protein